MHRPGAGAIIVRWRSSPATSSWNARRFWTRSAARSRTRSPAAAGSCSSQVRAGSGRRRPCGRSSMPPAAGGPCTGGRAIRSPRRCRWRRSSTLLPARSRPWARRSAGRAPPTTCSPRSGRSWATARRCSSSRTRTGPTRRPSTSCGSSAGGSRPCRSSWWSPTATSRPGGSIRCGSRWATWRRERRRPDRRRAALARTLCARSPRAAASIPRSSPAAPAAIRST